MFSYKIHKYGSDTVLAIADADLVGKELRSDAHIIKISAEFYGRNRTEAAEIASTIKHATIVNAMGNKSVELLLRHGIAKKSEVVTICGQAHVQVFFI